MKYAIEFGVLFIFILGLWVWQKLTRVERYVETHTR